MRVIMLKTDLLPYDDVADLFIIDPDGFIIRKWNSKQLNNGIMTADFQVSCWATDQSLILIKWIIQILNFNQKLSLFPYRYQIIQKLDFGQLECLLKDK